MTKAVKSEVTCELCGSIFLETRRKYYCPHCNKYFFVCNRCKEKGASCRFCGIPTKKQGEPIKIKKTNKNY